MKQKNNFINPKYCILIILYIAVSTSAKGIKALNVNADFGAYYTHIVTNDSFEKVSRTGDYADIIVDFGKENGRFVFWRGSSYLPYWENRQGEKFYAPEIIPRSGNGTQTMPDKVNSFSVVKIIENNSDRVVIHWRYLPVFSGKNPLMGEINNGFVDEYFTFSPNGSISRSIRKGTPKVEDWADPTFEYHQTFNLSPEGITNKQITQPHRSLKAEKKGGQRVISGSIVKPAAWFRFDEAIGDTAHENISGTAAVIMGYKTYWRRGISGTSVQFDDVSTSIMVPAPLAPKPENSITLEGWIAIGAYPWSWCPIIQQMDDLSEELPSDAKQHPQIIDTATTASKEKGYFLGIDGDGHPGLKIKVGGIWEELTAKIHLERRTWYHLTGTYGKSSGMLTLYLNGKAVAEKSVTHPGKIERSNKDLQIGRGKARRPINPVRASTFPGTYSFDGLLDELKLYDVALSPEQVKQSYANYQTTHESVTSVEMPARILPSGKKRESFGAEYSALKYYDSWDNLFRFTKGADVVVSLGENPSKFVFWRGVSYIPMIVNEKNQWYSNEFNETWGKSGGQGCQEPMSDKSSAYSHVRILENTPARVVVHWRFPLLDVEHVLANYDEKTGWSDWSDWYYYIYPDGVAVKKMQLWTDGERNHEWQESMAIFGPDQHPNQIIERTNTITMVTEDGQSHIYNWQDSPPKNIDEPKNSNIQLINYTGKYDPFTIGTNFESTNVYGGELTPYAVFCTWNHWPIAQMPSDGRYASYPDRAAHSSFTHVNLPVYKEATGDKPFYEKIMLEGMWNKSAADLIPLSKSWTHAPGLINLIGCAGSYDPEQRAYVLNVSDKSVSFTVNATPENPVHNLCFVIKGWNSKGDIHFTGAEKVKQGTVRDTDGSYNTVLFITNESVKPLNLKLSK